MNSLAFSRKLLPVLVFTGAAPRRASTSSGKDLPHSVQTKMMDFQTGAFSLAENGVFCKQLLLAVIGFLEGRFAAKKGKLFLFRDGETTIKDQGKVQF